MKKNIISAVLLCSTILLQACNSKTIKVERNGVTEHLVIPIKLQNAITAYTPTFRHWETSDFAQAIQNDTSRLSTGNATFALIEDFNKDGISDLILTGHEGTEKEIVLGILSQKSGYTVQLLDETSYTDPKTIENWDNGKKDTGLQFYLSQYKNPEGTEAFYIATAQISDKDGNLAGDGYMCDFSFESGTFTMKEPEAL